MVATSFNTSTKDDRLAQLWADLLADPVPPHPGAKGRMLAGFEMNDVTPPLGAPGWERPALAGMPRAAPPYTALEAKRLKPLPEDEPVSYRLRRGIETLFHSLLEPEIAESSLPSADNANGQDEAFSEMSMETAHEAILSFSSPFRWDPKPAWINSSAGTKPPFSNMVHPRLFVARPKIPIRPLHKQPFYRRFFFYLRRWLNMAV